MTGEKTDIAPPPPPPGVSGEKNGIASPPPPPGELGEKSRIALPPPPPDTEASPGQPAPPANGDLEVQLAGLKRQVRAGRRRSVVLGAGTVAAVLLAVASAAAYHLVSVYRYAALAEAPRAARDPVDPNRLSLVYRPASEGKVGFFRADVDRRTELLDRVVADAVGNDQTFHWRVTGLDQGDAIGVTYRQGLFLKRETLEMPEPPVVEAALTGQVVNAVNKEPVPNAQVRIVGKEMAATTGDEGWFRLDAAPSGKLPIEVSAPGFTAERFDWELEAGVERAIRVVLSPGLEEGQIRIVLTWDQEPADLDAHLKGPLPDGEEFHVYFHEKGDLKSEEFVRLDVDDRDGEGPETITVLGVLPGTYRYSVHNYSGRDDPRSSALAQSGAEVKVYQGGQTYRFGAGHDRPGNIWDVCTIEVTPEGAVVNKIDTYEGTESKALGLYAKRTMGDRSQWIANYGGSTISESTVNAALEWLARHQADDGAWTHRSIGSGSADSKCEPIPCTGSGKNYDMAHTGLALLAFQAGGHYDFNDKVYSPAVRRGLDWMVTHQRPDGGLVGSAKAPKKKRFHRQYMYEHGIAAFALAEACAVAAAMGEPENEPYVNAARRAVDFIHEMQHTDGGWRYTDELSRESDTSVTGWQILALKTAKEAGLPVSEECVRKVRDFCDSRASYTSGRTGYTSRDPITDATTGVGMLARQFLLDEPDAPLVRDAAEYLAGYAEKTWAGGQAAGNNKDFYLWYNCTLAMFQAGGEPWGRWNPVVRDTIIDLQRHDGCARGSWDPTSKWGQPGGRIYTTALAALTLEVYYRYTSPQEAEDAFQETVTAIDDLAPRPKPDSAELNLRNTSPAELQERTDDKSKSDPPGAAEQKAGEEKGLELREEQD